MPAHSYIVVIGASAGGVDALRRLLGRLPADFPAAVLIVLHIGANYSVLPKILAQSTVLEVQHAENNMPVLPGVVLVAPPDQHLLVEDGMVRLTHGAKENFSRPAIDPLFRTAASFYRQHAIGVLLTGLLDDGVIGLQAIKAYGGLAMVQHPADADEPSMPRSAIEHAEVDIILSAEALGDRLVEVVRAPPIQHARSTEQLESYEALSRFDLRQKTDPVELARIAAPSTFTCPDCHGSLWELKGVYPPHFRCHTGHSYSEQGLSAMQDMVIEEAVWAAVRALHEKQMMMQRFAERAELSGRESAKKEHEAIAATLAAHAETLRRMVVKKEQS